MATFRSQWTIAILGDYFTYNDIVRSLYVAGVPNCVSFRHDPNPTGKYSVESWTGWGKWPFPSQNMSNYIVVFSSQDSRFAQGGGYGGGTIGTRVSVQVWPSDSTIAIGQRIWHEILHGMNIDVDRAMDEDTADFCQYLRDNGSKFAGRFCDDSTRQHMSSQSDWHELLCEYNTFQMKRYFSSQCYGGVSPTVTPIQIPTPPPAEIVPVVEPPVIVPTQIEPDDPECVNGTFSCDGTTRIYCANGEWVDYQYYSTQCGYVPAEYVPPEAVVPEAVVYEDTPAVQDTVVYVTPSVVEKKKVVVIEQPMYSQGEDTVIAGDGGLGLAVVAIGAFLLFSIL